MRWIRGPAWDLAWVWSGAPMTVVVAGLPLWVVMSSHSTALLRVFVAYGPPRLPIPWDSPDRLLELMFAAALDVQAAHFMAPVAAAWSNAGFRRVMLRHRARYVWWPLAIVLVSAAVGVATQLGWTGYDLHHPHQLWRLTGIDNPFPLLIWVFWGWNAWHFSRQNFGVLLLCGVRRGTAWLVGFGGTMFAMVGLPYVAAFFGVGFLMMLAMTGLVSANHWIVELGMTARIASARPVFQGLFLGALLLLGLVGFLWSGSTPRGPILVIVPSVIGAFLGVNFVHFWYDQWIYRFSDPAVRATIGTRIKAKR